MRLTELYFLSTRHLLRVLKLLGRKHFIWPMQHAWGRWCTPTGPTPRVAAHMGLLSLANPMLGQDTLLIAGGNALTLFNDFGHDIPKMSSNISRFLITIAHHALGVLRTQVHRWQGCPRKRMRTERERERVLFND